MSLTVYEVLDTPRRIQEAEDKIIGILSDAKLTAVESVGLLEGIKAKIMRAYR